MTYIGSWELEKPLTFMVNTQNFSTGVPEAPSAGPTYQVYENGVTMGAGANLSGSMTQVSSITGFYFATINLLAAAGYENGKSYAIRIAATVGGVASATHKTFQILASVNAILVDDELPDTAATIADAVLDEVTAGHLTAGTLGAKINGLTFTTANRVDATLTTLPAFATDAITAASVSAAAATKIADSQLDQSAGVETGLTMRGFMRLAGAVLFGRATALNSSPIVFRDLNNVKPRVTVTVTAADRTGVTADTT